MEQYAVLILLGAAVGAAGTLIGAGGGFILVPLLALIWRLSPDTITAISLAVVFFNAASGSIAYARLKRIDYREGFLFAVATLPGAILGAYTTYAISIEFFDAVLGIALILVSIFLLVHPHENIHRKTQPRHIDSTHTIVERNGASHTYSYNSKLGVGISLIVGYLSSLLGIGGGIIHVPAMTYLLDFPVHVATAKSHFVVVIMALAGSLVHLARGTLQQTLDKTIPLAIGVVIGAQIGAKLSQKIRGDWIIRLLALALTVVGIRVLISAFSR